MHIDRVLNGAGLIALMIRSSKVRSQLTVRSTLRPMRHDLPAGASTFADRPGVLRQHLPEHRAPREPIFARSGALRHDLPAHRSPCVAISGRCVMIWLIVRQHLLSRPFAPRRLRELSKRELGHRVAHNKDYVKLYIGVTVGTY